jgi:hypothetical protein
MFMRIRPDADALPALGPDTTAVKLLSDPAIRRWPVV